jgi:hypothetical protein
MCASRVVPLHVQCLGRRIVQGGGDNGAKLGWPGVHGSEGVPGPVDFAHDVEVTPFDIVIRERSPQVGSEVGGRRIANDYSQLVVDTGPAQARIQIHGRDTSRNGFRDQLQLVGRQRRGVRGGPYRTAPRGLAIKAENARRFALRYQERAKRGQRIHKPACPCQRCFAVNGADGPDVRRMAH